MNKNWIILLLVTMLILEYRNGHIKTMTVPENYNFTYPTTTIKLQGRARGHKKYIDMRRVKRVWRIGVFDRILIWEE